MQKISSFIQEVLFKPGSGYYRKKNPLGKNSDFITAPEISQVFGELIAAYLLQIYSIKKFPISLVEMGAGQGTLFKDILTSIYKLADKNIPQALDFLGCASFHIIEISEVLREIQQKNLCKFGQIFWHEDFKGFLEKAGEKEFFFISNELFDCFPIDQFVKTKEVWRERMIDFINGKHQFVLAEFNQGIHNFLEKEIGVAVLKSAPIGAIFEYSQTARNFMSELCEALRSRGGMAIIIDYGYDENEFTNSLQSIKNHQKCPVLENLGESDITALVDFSALRKISESFGLYSSLVSQQKFLVGLGIEGRRKALLKSKKADEQREINSAINRLIDSKQMGELFKCLMVWK